MKSSAYSNEFDLDSILVELGEFGKYQIINYILFVSIVTLTAGTQSSYIFTARIADYRYTYIFI